MEYPFAVRSFQNEKYKLVFAYPGEYTGGATPVAAQKPAVRASVAAQRLRPAPLIPEQKLIENLTPPMLNGCVRLPA
jgi:hypothetical protein